MILAEALGDQDVKDAINRVRAADGLPALDGSEGSDMTKGQSYGPVTCIPLPDFERLNNPNAQ